MRAQNPRLGRAFELYLSCRQQQLFSIEISKDKRNKSVRVVAWPTGYLLPDSGGMLDQPHWLIETFDAFLQGERAAVFKSLK